MLDYFYEDKTQNAYYNKCIMVDFQVFQKRMS